MIKRESESKIKDTVEGFFKLTILQVPRCRYAQLNRNALRDADLFERTGRVRTPSPTPCTKSDRDVLEHSRESTRDARQTTKHEGFSSHDSWEQGFNRPLSREVVHLSSDSDVSLCQWAELTHHSVRTNSILCPSKTTATEADSYLNLTNSSNTPLETDSGSTPSESDFDFNFTDCESRSLPTSSEFEDTEEEPEETDERTEHFTLILGVNE